MDLFTRYLENYVIGALLIGALIALAKAVIYLDNLL